MNTTQEELLKRMDEDVQILVLVTGTLQDGSAHYAYASIPPSKYTAFKEAEAKGNYNLRDYGRILQHGTGQPNAAIQKQMEEQYGASHRFEEELEDVMLKMQAALK